jgi:hypothetical protein
VVLQQRQRHDQRHQPLPAVLDETQELQPTAGRPCLRSTGDSSGSPSVLEDVYMLGPGGFACRPSRQGPPSALHVPDSEAIRSPCYFSQM